VQVTDANGRTTYEGVLHAGQAQQLGGTSPLTIRLGNTRAITISVNGTQLDLAGVANTANVHFAVS
jgi:hypothetical protein